MRTETFIHQLALVEPGAVIGQGAFIGPFCHVGPDAVIGDRTRLISSVIVMGATTIGSDCVVYPQAVLGGLPQNHGHKGGRTTLVIGDNCTIREFVTMHTGSDNARGTTLVGNKGTFLAYSHIAHDCIVGNSVTLTNCATLGGHVELGDNVSIGGLTAVHQFTRIGQNAFVAGGAMVVGDIIPYAIAAGNRAKLRGLNLVGLKRGGMSRDAIKTLRQAYRMIFDRSTPMAENLEAARAQFAGVPEAMKIVDFLSARGKRHYTVPPLKGAADDSSDDDV